MSLLQVFEKIPGLLFLYAQKNLLKEVPVGLPSTLEQLSLSRNRITKIPGGAFKNLDKLSLLDLYDNQVKLLTHNSTPSHIIMSKFLQQTQCCLFQLSDSDLGKNTFKDLKNLVQLNLAHNALKKMPAGVPAGLVQLFLDKNRIDDIPKQVHSACAATQSLKACCISQRKTIKGNP